MCNEVLTYSNIWCNFLINYYLLLLHNYHYLLLLCLLFKILTNLRYQNLCWSYLNIILVFFNCPCYFSYKDLFYYAINFYLVRNTLFFLHTSFIHWKLYLINIFLKGSIIFYPLSFVCLILFLSYCYCSLRGWGCQSI